MANCRSCGLSIPDGQKDVCSMCYGDIGHGKDGFYEEWARHQMQEEECQRQAEEEEWENRQREGE